MNRNLSGAGLGVVLGVLGLNMMMGLFVMLTACSVLAPLDRKGRPS